MSISQIKHQDGAIQLLQQAINSGRMAHGYVFVGPEGIGKALTARELAKLLLCEKPVKISRGPGEGWVDSCGTCQDCRLMQAGTHGDFHHVHKELITLMPGKERHKATELGIDVIRQELISKAALHPVRGRAKVFMVSEAHLMSTAAQNALLKTLEEPPPQTFIILLTNSLRTIVPTIQSRCQHVRFHTLPQGFILDKLEQMGITGRQAAFLARFAHGRIGRAVELSALSAYDLKCSIGRSLAQLTPAGAAELSAVLQDSAKALAQQWLTAGKDQQTTAGSESELNRRSLKLVLSLAVTFYDDALCVLLGASQRTLMNQDQPDVVNQLVATLRTASAAIGAIRLIGRCESVLDANVNVALAVTDMSVALASVGRTETPAGKAF